MSGASAVHVASDLSDLVGRCDAALVALPNYLHAPACIPLLEQGCHVLVEKPMAASVEDCDRLIAAARGSGAVLSVAMVRRFIAAYELVREVISKQTFGAIRRIRVAEGVAYNWPATTGFFLKKDQAGGGVLVDFGSHVLDALLWWLGDLTVSAYEDDAYGGVEAECHVQCTSTAGVAVDIELSRLRRLACTARIECEHATVEISLHSGSVDLIIAGTRTPIRGRVGVPGQARLDARCRPVRAAVARVSERHSAECRRDTDGNDRSRRRLPVRRVRRKATAARRAGQPRRRARRRGSPVMRVLVLGATGFIGTRVVDELVLRHGAEVRATVRDYRKAVRLGRLPVEWVEATGDRTAGDA